MAVAVPPAGKEKHVATLVIDGGEYGSESPQESADGHEHSHLAMSAQRHGGGISFAVSRTRFGSRRGTSSGDAPSRFDHPTHAGFVSAEDPEPSWCGRLHDLAVVRWHLPRCPR